MSDENKAVLNWLIMFLTAIILAGGGYFFGNTGRSGELESIKDNLTHESTINQVQDVQITEIQNTLVEIKQGVQELNRKWDSQKER